ncbi:MAG: nitronate monooxygenase [Alphaproteobacteria bacterium]|nr:nitronate monooxygenase [Alphaproteobacteria bacterium]
MVTPSSRLQGLMRRGCDFLGTELAIMGGAMSWISERNLVAAVSNGGGFGIIACGSMTPDLLRAEIQATRALTNRPFGVNLMTMHPQLEALIDVCLEEKAGHVVLAGGLPPAPAAKKIKDGGAKLICFAPAAVLARRLLRIGVDALIIEGSEAGGHIGSVSTSVLAQEILPVIRDVPVFVAGGVGRGDVMLSYLEMGAAGVQIGTRLVCASECVAHPNFKQAYIRAAARDAVPSPQLDARFSVIPVRALTNDGTRAFLDKQRDVIARFDSGALTKEAAQLEIERFWVGALRKAVIDGDVANGSVMAGQIVSLVTSEQPVGTILGELIAQAGEALQKRQH